MIWKLLNLLEYRFIKWPRSGCCNFYFIFKNINQEIILTNKVQNSSHPRKTTTDLLNQRVFLIVTVITRLTGARTRVNPTLHSTTLSLVLHIFWSAILHHHIIDKK